MNKFIGLILVASACLAATPTWADKVADDIIARLKAVRPGLEYGTPAESPIAGLYQVQVVGGPTLYVDKEGGHFIAGGDLYVIQGGEFVNLQEQARSKDRAALMAGIDPKDQIIFAPEGETKAVINVFTDVDCGYCQKLHREIEQINAMGIEVRYLAYPRAGPDSESAQKLAKAWCAKDRQETLTKLKNREFVEAKACADNPVAAQYQLGVMAGVTGTPNMVTPDGEMIGGYLPADKLAELLGI